LYLTNSLSSIMPFPKISNLNIGARPKPSDAQSALHGPGATKPEARTNAGRMGGLSALAPKLKTQSSAQSAQASETQNAAPRRKLADLRAMMTRRKATEAAQNNAHQHAELSAMQSTANKPQMQQSMLDTKVSNAEKREPTDAQLQAQKNALEAETAAINQELGKAQADAQRLTDQQAAMNQRLQAKMNGDISSVSSEGTSDSGSIEDDSEYQAILKEIEAQGEEETASMEQDPLLETSSLVTASSTNSLSTNSHDEHAETIDDEFERMQAEVEAELAPQDMKPSVKESAAEIAGKQIAHKINQMQVENQKAAEVDYEFEMMQAEVDAEPEMTQQELKQSFKELDARISGEQLAHKINQMQVENQKTAEVDYEFEMMQAEVDAEPEMTQQELKQSFKELDAEIAAKNPPAPAQTNTHTYVSVAADTKKDSLYDTIAKLTSDVAAQVLESTPQFDKSNKAHEGAAKLALLNALVSGLRKEDNAQALINTTFKEQLPQLLATIGSQQSSNLQPAVMHSAERPAPNALPKPQKAIPSATPDSLHTPPTISRPNVTKTQVQPQTIKPNVGSAAQAANASVLKEKATQSAAQQHALNQFNQNLIRRRDDSIARKAGMLAGKVATDMAKRQAEQGTPMSTDKKTTTYNNTLKRVISNELHKSDPRVKGKDVGDLLTISNKQFTVQAYLDFQTKKLMQENPDRIKPPAGLRIAS
jgi:hypothetical protein